MRRYLMSTAILALTIGAAHAQTPPASPPAAKPDAPAATPAPAAKAAERLALGGSTTRKFSITATPDWCSNRTATLRLELQPGSPLAAPDAEAAREAIADQIRNSLPRPGEPGKPSLHCEGAGFLIIELQSADGKPLGGIYTRAPAWAFKFLNPAEFAKRPWEKDAPAASASGGVDLDNAPVTGALITGARLGPNDSSVALGSYRESKNAPVSLSLKTALPKFLGAVQVTSLNHSVTIAGSIMVTKPGDHLFFVELSRPGDANMNDQCSFRLVINAKEVIRSRLSADPVVSLGTGPHTVELTHRCNQDSPPSEMLRRWGWEATTTLQIKGPGDQMPRPLRHTDFQMIPE